MHSLARRVPIQIYDDSEVQQHAASEECLAACVESKLVATSVRRRSSSLDTTKKSMKHTNRKFLAEKQHMERMVCC